MTAFRFPAWLAVMVAASISACGGNSDTRSGPMIPAPVQQSAEIYGVASFDGPLAGAEVAVFALDGSRIGQTLTTANGHFQIATKSAIRDYFVTVTGGTFKGQALRGALRSEVRDRPEYGAYAPVNPVTNLIAQRMLAKPNLSYRQSVADVTRFLGIPQAYGIGINLTPEQFSGRVFAQAVIANGSLTGLSSSLLQELDIGKTHYFQEPLLREGEVGVAEFIAEGIASGVLGEVGGDAFSSVLGFLGIGGSDGADQAARAQAARFAQIASAIAALSTKVTESENTLLAAGSKSTYTLAFGAIQKYIDDNNWIDQELQVLAVSPNYPTRRASAGDFIRLNLYEGRMQAWDSALNGVLSSEGLLALYGRAVQQSNMLGVYGPSEAALIQQQWDFLDGEQARTLAFIVDFMRARPTEFDQTRDIIPMIMRWRSARQQQLARLRGTKNLVDRFYYPGLSAVQMEETALNHLPPQTVIDKTSMLMWTTRPDLVFDTGRILSPDAFQSVLAGVVTSLEGSTGLIGGWAPPHDRSTIPHTPGDTTNFDTLRRWGLPLPPYCSLVTQENILTWAKTKPAPFGPVDPNWAFVLADGPIYDKVIGDVYQDYSIGEASKWLPLMVSEYKFTYYKYYSYLNSLFPGGRPTPSFISDDKPPLGASGVYTTYNPCFQLVRKVPVPVVMWYE